MGALTQAQLRALGRIMQARMQVLRDEIREELARAGSDAVALDAGEVRDQGDQLAGLLAADVDASRVGRHIREIRETEAALARLAAGEYGDCEECGRVIAYGRLEINPAARRCVACQEKHEHPAVRDGG